MAVLTADTEHTAEPHPFARWLELLR